MNERQKICFVTLGNIYLCPYLDKYLARIDDDVDVIFWNRHNKQEKLDGANVISFNYSMDENSNKFNKIKGYLLFSLFTYKIILRKKYKRLVLLQTSVSILLSMILLLKYRRKYIIDIRDYTLEHNKIFYSFLKVLIMNAYNVVISSEGYREFLPPYEYTLVHNDIEIPEESLKEFNEKRKKNKRIVISYVGLVRFNEENKKNILVFKNDCRFLLQFIGAGSEELSSFIAEHNIENVVLRDYFPASETLKQYEGTDIIYNLYGNSTPLLDYALSNKLYYAAKLNIPILVCPNTYMEKISTEYSFGIKFDRNEAESLESLVERYNSIRKNKLEDGCKEFLTKVKQDNIKFLKLVSKFANENNEVKYENSTH